MKKKKTVTLKLTRGEKVLLSCCIFLGFAMVLVQVFCGATQGNLSISVEKLKYEIRTNKLKTQEAYRFLAGHFGYIEIANVKNLKEKIFYIE